MAHSFDTFVLYIVKEMEEIVNREENLRDSREKSIPLSKKINHLTKYLQKNERFNVSVIVFMNFLHIPSV